MKVSIFLWDFYKVLGKEGQVGEGVLDDDGHEDGNEGNSD